MRAPANMTDVTATSFSDSVLAPDAPYEYRVTARASRGEQVSSPPASRSIHALVATWDSVTSAEIVPESTVDWATLTSVDADGDYVTGWDHVGPDDSGVDFGEGKDVTKGPDCGGSIAVDDDGFIYVADVYNRRMQKFAP